MIATIRRTLTVLLYTTLLLVLLSGLAKLMLNPSNYH